MRHGARRHRGQLAIPALVLLGAGVLAVSCARPPVGNRLVPEPAKPVDLARYLGRWYEIGRFENGFERGCEAVTADYALLPDGRVRVVNACRVGGLDGREKRTEGAAKIVPDSGGAKLRVSFFGPFYLGRYWVLDHADDYGWSIVGEPSGRYLWLLARVPHPDPELRAALTARAGALGYDTSLISPDAAALTRTKNPAGSPRPGQSARKPAPEPSCCSGSRPAGASSGTG